MTESELRRSLTRALGRAEDHLLSLQETDGHWCGELEGDSILESEYALLLAFLGRAGGRRFRRLANRLRSEQQPGGGWVAYPGGAPEVSASVKAYFALELAGDEPEAPHMAAARRTILELGGLDACNSYTKVLLAVFGVYPWSEAPAIPPELLLLPRWLYVNLWEMSAWTRTIVVPLAIVWASRPHRAAPSGSRLRELRVEGIRTYRPRAGRGRVWGWFFIQVDRSIKLVERTGFLPLRRRALQRAEEWIDARLPGSDGLGAIYPAIMNAVMALVCRGRSVEHPSVRSQLEALEELEVLEGEELRIQPCLSPVWDTALAMSALLEAGRPEDDPRLRQAARWLLDRQVLTVGDWRRRAPEAPPGGWYFEYANEPYPDCDDTAEVLWVLSRIRFSSPEEENRRREALRLGLDWQLAMQGRAGGWGAFDRDCDRRILEYVPFADHNAMLDPPTTDVTARTVAALVEAGLDPEDAVVRRACAFLRAEQEEDGAWYGRWGANYIYGTWLALGALRAGGGSAADRDALRRGAGWLLRCQNADGGWGESLRSYEDPSTRGQGETTAAQTAWAVMGLLAADPLESEVVREAVGRGVRCLLASQPEEGRWEDRLWTGTGFPGVFYLRYHLYASYFPLQALAQYRRALERSIRKREAA